jgi:chromodomain-helicase-DNA-binding protein 1
VAGFKGFKRLDNYFRKEVEKDLYAQISKDVDPEAYEQHMVQREADRESQRDFHVVERVIGSRDGEDGLEYYVKCRCFMTTAPIQITNNIQGRA